MEFNFPKKKPLLPERTTTKNHRLFMRDHMLGKQRIAITQVQQTRPAIVDPKPRMSKAPMHPQIIEMIKISRPTRTLVHFLQRDNIRLQPPQQR